MNILILGGSGMVGHHLWMELSRTHDAWGTIRSVASALPDIPNILREHIISGVDATHLESIIEAFTIAQPDLVINCIGLIKQHEKATDPLTAIDLNARFPHQLALLCQATGSRLIHISTDCVFSGKEGIYIEDDPSDAEDIYGKTKLLGEVIAQSHCLTIRTSFIGRELTTRYGLVEWFLSQNQKVTGYQKAIFSGFTTQAFAKMLRDHVLPRPDLHGLYHISVEPISKYDLLHLFNAAYNKNLEIVPNVDIVIDRSLDSTRFRQATGFKPPAWQDMIEAMAADPTPYDHWKRS
ncbi:MAG: SDR family oxidoreductase [Anaerolineales bacterium]|nr:SDR family oxidoreductase [Anaerolineales bacterium]